MIISRLVTWLAVILVIFCGYSYIKVFIYSNTQSSMAKVIDTKQILYEDDTFKKRRINLNQACEAKDGSTSSDSHYEYLSNNRHFLNHLLIDHTHRVIYCYVPKVACTNWKKVLFFLTHNTDYKELDDIPSDSVHREGVFTKMSTMDPSDILQTLKSYDKFLFVREPMERLISAFRNKFERNYKSSAYFKGRFGVKIMKMYRRNGEPISRDGNGVKFNEFVQYLIDIFLKNPSKLNEHWAPFHQLCHPCKVKYNLIGKYDSLARDAEYVLKTIGALDTIHFPEVKPSKTTALVESYMETLSSAQLAGLYNVYKSDFINFDYEFRTYIKNGSVISDDNNSSNS